MKKKEKNIRLINKFIIYIQWNILIKKYDKKEINNSNDIDEREKFLSPKISESNNQVILKHFYFYLVNS